MRKDICIGLTTLTVILCVVGWFILPNRIMIQGGWDETKASTLTKLFTILIPIIISMMGCVINKKQKKKNNNTGVFFSAVGTILIALLIFFNRK